MSKEEDFYPIRSKAVGSLITFINSCQELGRDLEEELNEILWEAQDEVGIKDKRQIQKHKNI